MPQPFLRPPGRALAAFVLAVLPAAAASHVGPPPTPPSPEPVALVVVSEHDRHLRPMLAPLAARLAGPAGPPLLLAVSGNPADHAAKLIGRYPQAGRLFLDGWPAPRPATTRPASGVTVALDTDATRAAVKIARAFWARAPRVVVCDPDDGAACILGSTLAAHLGAPVIPLAADAPRGHVRSAFIELGVRQVLLAHAARPVPTLPELPDVQVTVLDQRDLTRRIVRAIGADRVEGVVLALAPESARGAAVHVAAGDEWVEPADGLDTGACAPDAAAWYAPYVSLVRSAAVVLCGSSDGREAEAAVDRLVRAERLAPRTVTILGDHGAIAPIPVTDSSRLGTFEVAVEPCSGAGPGASAYGVGRLPFAGLSDVSHLFCIGLHRTRAGGDGPVLMVANPRTEYGALPLAETVARLTARELRNAGREVREFYGVPADDANILAAAASAGLIIYQGHVSDQALFCPPQVFDEGAEDVVIIDATGPAPDDGWPAPQGAEPPMPDPPAELTGTVEPSVGGDPAGPAEDYGWGADEAYEPLPPPADRPPIELGGLPLVILQSCHSLEEDVARRVLHHGGVGLIGSVTNIHSASGSALIKAFCDQALGGESVGEALRDARNYFLCLAKLKAARGHTEQAKVLRAALSFRLWGDPALPAINAPAPKPVLPPVQGRLARAGVSIRLPRKRLETVTTEKYLGRIFPGARVAGIVRRHKSRPQRSLMSLYYLRLPLAGAGKAKAPTAVVAADPGDVRAVVLHDPLGRFLHLLYFPAKEKARERIELPLR